MNIPVIDCTANWQNILTFAVQRWSDALAPRGITLAYERRGPGSAGDCDQGRGVINVCDSIPRPETGQLGDGFVCQDVWVGSYVRLYVPPDQPLFSMAIAVHELGHALMLNHVEPGFDSVMTPIPRLQTPSAWDIANAMPGYPMTEQAPEPPPSPPASDHHDKHKDKRKRKKHGR